MSDDLEDLLRAEFAGRAQSAPGAHDTDLAEAAIGGARRIRRRRRVATAAGGAGLAVVAAAAIVWTPWDLAGDDAPPVATHYQEVEESLALEYVVERDGGWGLVDSTGAYTQLQIESEPSEAWRVEDGYLLLVDNFLMAVDLDGTTAVGVGVGDAAMMPEVRPDAEGVALSFYDEQSERMFYDLYPASVDGLAGEARALNLSSDLAVANWSDSTLVARADLTTVTGASSGTYNFDEQYDFGLGSAAVAGFEAAVLTDYSDPEYVCVSDLEPGTATTSSESCGYLDGGETEGEMEGVIAAAAGTDEALATVTEAGRDLLPGAIDHTVAPDESLGDTVWERERVFADPLLRWEIGFDVGDRDWQMLAYTEDEVHLTEVRPPDGAVLPVQSYR